jgi:hypothetical protein
MGLTKVVLGIKQVIGNTVAVVLGKVVKPQLQRHLKTVGGLGNTQEALWQA